MNHDDCCHSIINYSNPYHWLRENYEFKSQHSEPIEFEELSGQLRQRSRGKEGNARFANEGTFVFWFHSFWVPLWTLESEVCE